MRLMTASAVDVKKGTRKRSRGKVAPSKAARPLDRVTTSFVGILRHKFRDRLEALVAAGLDVALIEKVSGQLADAMLNLLPEPNVAARVSGPVWTTEQVRLALARDGKPVSTQAINDRVKRGTLLALQVKEAGERAYPLWQFKQDTYGWTVMTGLADVLQAIPESSMSRWTLSSWLQRPNQLLNNQSPLEALQKGDSKHVLSLANSAAERWSH